MAKSSAQGVQRGCTVKYSVITAYVVRYECCPPDTRHACPSDQHVYCSSTDFQIKGISGNFSKALAGESYLTASYGKALLSRRGLDFCETQRPHRIRVHGKLDVSVVYKNSPELARLLVCALDQGAVFTLTIANPGALPADKSEVSALNDAGPDASRWSQRQPISAADRRASDEIFGAPRRTEFNEVELAMLAEQKEIEARQATMSAKILADEASWKAKRKDLNKSEDNGEVDMPDATDGLLIVEMTWDLWRDETAPGPWTSPM